MDVLTIAAGVFLGYIAGAACLTVASLVAHRRADRVRRQLLMEEVDRMRRFTEKLGGEDR